MEILVAIAIISVVLVLFVSASVKAMGNLQFSKNQILATRFSQEGIELTRSKRANTDWISFIPLCPVINQQKDQFILNITCDCTAGDSCRVTSTVTWTDAKGEHSSVMTTNLVESIK